MTGAQIIILLAVVILFGFHWQGVFNSIILAVIIGIIGGVASISLGMIIASFAKNPPQASQLGTLIAVPVSFLVGAFFQLPQVLLEPSWARKFRYTLSYHGIRLLQLLEQF